MIHCPSSCWMHPDSGILSLVSCLPEEQKRKRKNPMETPSTLSGISANPELYPTIISQELSSDSASFVFEISSRLKFFQGHFDQFPILPGVVQVDWVYRFAQLVFKLDIPSEIDIPNVKFSYPIYPDVTIYLNLEYDIQKSKLSFKYRNQNKICSSGVLRFSS